MSGRETFAAARARILSELAALGHGTRPSLKVPRASLPGGVTLELRAQSAHASTRHRSLSVRADYRGAAASDLVREAASLAGLLGDPS